MVNLIKTLLTTIVLTTGIAQAEVCIHLTSNTIGEPGDKTIFRITAIDHNPLKRDTIISQPIPYSENLNDYFQANHVSNLNTLKIETLTTTGATKSTIMLHCENANIQVPTASIDISLSQDPYDKNECFLESLPHQSPMNPCSSSK